MKKLLLIMLITICSMSATFGQQVFPSTQPNINLTAGTLDGYFTYAELNAITELTITGEINATDLLCIQGARLTFPYATKIDLSQANIVEYKGKLQYEPSYASDKTYYANAYVNAMGNTSQYHTFLTTFNIPNSTTEIVQHSLSHFQFNYRFVYGGCMSAMREFTIPKNVTKIGYQIFVYSYRDNVLDTCTLTSLTTKILDPRLCTTDINAFDGVNKISCTLHVPYGTSTLYRAIAPWNQFQTIVEDVDFTGNVATAGTLNTLFTPELIPNVKSITITGFYNEDDIAFVQNNFPFTLNFNTSGATFLSKLPLFVRVDSPVSISTLFTPSQLTSTTVLIVGGYYITQGDIDYVKNNFPNLVTLLCDETWMGGEYAGGGCSYYVYNDVAGNLWTFMGRENLSYYYSQADITNLYVSGKINQADLDFIGAYFTYLVTLDVSGTTFVGVPTDIATHEENKITIYPNPCANGFNISRVGNYQLLNSSGVTVKNVVGGEYVDVSDLAKGIYFVRGVGENEAVCFKVVKR